MTSPERPPRSPEIACNHLETEHPERMRTQPRTQDALATPRDRSRAPRLRLGTPRHHLGTVPHSLGRPGPPSRDAHGTISASRDACAHHPGTPCYRLEAPRHHPGTLQHDLGTVRHHLGRSGTPSWDAHDTISGRYATISRRPCTPSWHAVSSCRHLEAPRHHLGTPRHRLGMGWHHLGRGPTPLRTAQRLSRRPPPKREKPSRDEIWSLGTSISRDGCETISGGTLPRALSR